MRSGNCGFAAQGAGLLLIWVDWQTGAKLTAEAKARWKYGWRRAADFDGIWPIFHADRRGGHDLR